jgi:hypothetical protein
MPQKINLNVPPYNDDFEANKNFYKILFRPGYSIQSRELTTLQSILQNQIESFGKNLFKQGDMIVPGEIGFNNSLNYVKLSSVSDVASTDDLGNVIFQKYNIKNLIGYDVRGLSSGVVGSVVAAEIGNEFESDVIFVNYKTSGNSNNEKTFRQGENLEVIDLSDSPILVVGTDGSVLPTSIIRYDGETGTQLDPITSKAMGYASAVQIQEGIYFINGFFVQNKKEILVIDKYYNKSSSIIGFSVEESVVVPEEDFSLYDNAKGFSNYSAPGAHRLKINVSLQSYNFDQSYSSNFVKLLSIKNGIVENIIKPADYSLIEEVLSQRTFDESGDYVVDNFNLDLREYYQSNTNKGIYPENSNNLVNDKYTVTQSNSKMLAGIGPGKAYIKGYEVVNKELKYIEVDKARDTFQKDNNRIKIKNIPSYNVSNVYNSIALNNVGQDIVSYPTLYLNNVFNDGSLGFNDTETASSYKQTVNRRGKSFDVNDGIKTIYIQLGSGKQAPSNTNLYTYFVNSSNQSSNIDYPALWYIKTRASGSNTTTTANSLEILASSLVSRPDLTPNILVELTVRGNKYDLQELLLEYDNEDIISTAPQTNLRRRKLFLDRTSAVNNSDYWGYLVDYNEVITPIIGLSKPKNFSFLEKGSGFNSDKDKILSKGRLPDGTASYNSIFSLSYFNPVFFTKITVDTKITTGFDSGRYITGSMSGAYAVVENTQNGQYSLTNSTILFVKTLSGRFIPGETIVDESGNSLRIARENTISHFVVTKRGTNFDPIGARIAINGEIIATSAVNVAVDTNNSNSIFSITVKDRNLLSQEYFYPPTIEATDISTSAVNNSALIEPVLYKNTVTYYSDQDVKSISSQIGSAYKFTCDVESSINGYYNSKSVTNYIFIGSEGNKYLECQGFSGDASIYLKQGDIIQYTDINNKVIRSIVQYATKPQGLLKSRIYIDSSLQENVSSNVLKIYTKVENSNSTLLIPSGSQYLKSIVSSDADSKISYYLRKDFIVSASSSGGTITFRAELQYGTQSFADYSEGNFFLTILNNGGSTEISNGDILYIKKEWVNIQNTTDTSGLTAGTVVINIPSTYFGTQTGGVALNFTNLKLKLSATLKTTKALPRLKTIKKNKRIRIDSAGDKVIILRGQDYDTGDPDVLSYSDAIKINYIYEGTTTSTPTVNDNGELIDGKDLSDQFTFDDGQRDSFYDVSRIVLKPGYDTPKGILLVSFDYFEHAQGDFCTVDSYLHDSGVKINEIPEFNSSVYGKISLRDVIDFRPKVDSTSTFAGFQNSSLISQPNYSSFNQSGGAFSATPAPDDVLSYTIEFSSSQYLDRIDAVSLSKDGNFSIVKGNSSLNPVKPEDQKDSLALYYLYIPSYTSNVNDVKVISVDNKRYTMKDIGKLEKRLERLENYTQLSILEQQALNMQIKDELSLERFKTGFAVDGFDSHLLGNLVSDDHLCSIDTQQSVLRPQSVVSNVDLQELNTIDDERINNNYVNTNGIITLPFNTIKSFSNIFATDTLNPNPFIVLQYVGDASLSPSIDNWYNDTEVPSILNNDGSLYSVFYAKLNTKNAFNSIFNFYLTNWVGINKVFHTKFPLNILSRDLSTSTIKLSDVSSSSNISPQNTELPRGVGIVNIAGKSVVSSINLWCRSKAITFKVTRLKPNTKVYPFVDGINIGRWVAPDYKFTGIPGNSVSYFGNDIITDNNGNASGLLLIPSGHPPTQGSGWNNDINLLEYDSSYPQVNISVGIKTVRFTSSSVDNKTTADTFTEVKYYATGILPPPPSSITSTTPPFFKSEEGVQYAETSKNTLKPNPLSQTFKIENYTGGVFLTGVDLFFNKKSDTLPVKVYLTNTESSKPGKYIIPGSESVKYPYTNIKIYTNGSVNINKNEYASGVKSGAIGPIYSVLDKNNIELTASIDGEFTLQSDQVYTLILSNHNGVSFVEDEKLDIASVIKYNAVNNTELTVTIAKNSGRISNLRITNTGSNYESLSLTIQSPSLPGGSTAEATAYVSNGELYEVKLNLSGSGYTSIPSIVIEGSGAGNGGAAISAILTIDNPAVVMGVATDKDETDLASTPTRFEFEYPVYLQNNSEYTLVIETDSTDYLLWSSKLGKKDITNNAIVTQQPLLGSVFRSQNINNWTEDIFEDIKFIVYRAQFNTKNAGTFQFVNNPLGYEKLGKEPFETDSSQDSSATSNLFRNNNRIVKVYHDHHGFESLGNSFVNYKNAKTSGGINESILNSTLFEVKNSSNNFYHIQSTTRAGSTVFGGGQNVLASFNRKYEILYPQIATLTFDSTKLDTSVKTTNVVPYDSYNVSFSSYSQASDYERTFLNEEHFFTNQKIVCSEINKLKNNIDQSLSYKLVFTSEVDNLSPVIDARYASVKVKNNIVENPTGYENRFGARYQILEFYPIYRMSLTLSGTAPTADQTVTGATTKAQGTVVKWDAANGKLYVKMKTTSIFSPLESLSFSSQTTLVASVGNLGVEYYPINFAVGTTFSAMDSLYNAYTNKISGKIVSWDSKNRKLYVLTNKQPINDDYTSPATVGSSFARTTLTNQLPDIFRVGDVCTYQGIVSGEEKYIEISSTSQSTGITYVSDLNSKNSSSISKYVTKEITIEIPSTCLDVRIKANVLNSDNIKVYYKIREANSQFNFDDIDWREFNPGGTSNNAVIPSSSNSISGYFEQQESYKEYQYNAANLPEFTSYSIKIVMNTSDPCYVPKIQDFRCVSSV